MAKLSTRRENFMYSYDEFAPVNLTFQMHHYYEILFFKRGSANYIIDGVEYLANAGDVFITAPHELHSIVFTSEDTYERHFVQVGSELLEMLSPSLPAKFNSAAQKHKIAAADVEKFGIDKLFYNIHDCALNERLEYEVIMQSYILQMLVAICDCASISSETPIAATKRTQKIKKYINENFTRNLSLDEIADNVFFNKYYMCHIFKEDTGMTIKEYIELSRFMYARKLHFQGVKMSEIASRCGYSDYSLFYKSFTKYSGGQSPTAFFLKNG